MKKIYTFIILFIISISLYGKEHEDKLTIAIFDCMSIPDSKNDSNKEIVYSTISSTIVSTHQCKVVERGQLEKLKSEHKLQYSKLMDDSQAIELGKYASANKIILPKIIYYEDGTSSLDIKLLDIKTGTIDQELQKDLPKEIKGIIAEVKSTTLDMIDGLHSKRVYASKEYANGDRYKGDFVNDKKEGSGVMYYVDDSRYEGNWKNDKQDGQGSMYYSIDDKEQRDKYIGMWRSGKKHGAGDLYWSDGTHFKGNWINNVRSGQGEISYINGDEYKGGWLNDKFDGNGTYTYSKNNNELNEYIGEWKDGRKNGFGRLVYVNGARYEGDWINDKQEGRGIYTYPLLNDQEEKYVGGWKDGEKSGFGILYYDNGNRYEGMWQHNKKVGKGILYKVKTLKNGEKIIITKTIKNK